MSNAFETWKPLPHEPFETLAENLWFVRGSLPGMSLRRNMVVARTNKGALVIHNAVAMHEGDQQKLEALGLSDSSKEAFLVIPNAAHRLDSRAYKARYPHLKTLGPKGSKKGIEEVIALDMIYEDWMSKYPDEGVCFSYVPGIEETEGSMLVQSKDGATLVINDSVFNMDPKKDLLGNVITRVIGSAPGPRVSRMAKMLFIKDKAAFKQNLLALAETPNLERLIVSHDKIAEGKGAREALLEAATYL